MSFKNISHEQIAALRALIGAKQVITDHERLHDYAGDEFPQHHIRHYPDVVVKPENTDQVRQIVRLAHEGWIPVTARGGGTGLCGGCVPVHGGIVISFERMARVVEVDRDNLMAVVEAGCTLADFYQAIETAGLFFPPHPGDENATIGGVIATNAGGARAVKYGVIRNFIRGIEVVLANGDVVHSGGKLIKNSSGYSLLHLLIGSEGTLGIITQATLSLAPQPAALYTLVVPFDTLSDAIAAVPAIIRNRILPMAVEFVERDAIAVTEAYTGRKWPSRRGRADLMFVVDAGSEDEAMLLAERIGDICLQHQAQEVFIADTPEKQSTILALRSGIYAAMRSHMAEILDVTVPPARIAGFVDGVHAIEERVGIWLPTYGHAADGNVHTNIMQALWQEGDWRTIPDGENKARQARREIHELGHRLQGLVSGEHGIGLVKKEYLPLFLEARQLELMQAIKHTFDPTGILNPGKVCDPEIRV